jgi:hypothetical protein
MLIHKCLRFCCACRHSEYQLLSQTWSVRPTVPVSAAPAAWWKHACAAVLAECRQRRPPGSMRQALSRRRQYIALYTAVHSGSSGYVRTAGERRHAPRECAGAVVRSGLIVAGALCEKVSENVDLRNTAT